MNWFYANAGQQSGPVNDADFERLAREGVIQPTTLVWREGMANWEPYSKVAPAPSATSFVASAAAAMTAAPPPAGQVACHECGKFVPIEDTMQINGVAICAVCKPVYVQKMREGTVPFIATVSNEPRFAGFWIRVGAYVIDQVILNLVALPTTIWLTVRMQNIMQQGFQGGQFDWGAYLGYMGLSSAIGIFISILYNVFFVGRYAATLGKMLVKIKIVTADGGRVTYLRALGRLGGQIVSSMTCMIGYLLPIWDPEKRALHDHMCNTRVVYK